MNRFSRDQETSIMAENKDGIWQVRENAAFEAAGLNPSTATNSCSALQIEGCAFVGTLLGGGGTTESKAIDISRDVLDVGDRLSLGRIGKYIPILWGKMLTYGGSFGARYQGNIEYCRANCNKQAFQR